MANLPTTVWLVAGVSVIFGVVMLTASSLFMYDWSYWFQECNKQDYDGELCAKTEFFIAGAALGIIAASLQILFTAIEISESRKGNNTIVLRHGLIFLLLVIGFIVPASGDAFDIETIPKEFGKLGIHRVHRSRAWFFMIFALVDAIYTFFIMCLLLNLTIKEEEDTPFVKMPPSTQSPFIQQFPVSIDKKPMMNGGPTQIFPPVSMGIQDKSFYSMPPPITGQQFPEFTSAPVHQSRFSSPPPNFPENDNNSTSGLW